MPDVSDWHAFLAKQETANRAKRAREALQTLPRMAEATQKSQQVLDHPGWQHFADLLTSRIAAVKTTRTGFADRMVNGSEMGAQLELLKLNVNKCDAELAGLHYALSLMPQAVEIGQRIAGEMSGLVAAAGADT
jgi:hypothetical protein